jgi:Cys-tRNA(Pro)/Cys-tRNA(Cys) deacylase
MKKPFPTFFHQSALNFDKIFVSAGVRGLQLEIAPNDIITYVKATVCDIIKTNDNEQ